MSETLLPLSAGGRFGRYRVVRHLCSTLATEVYEAEHERLGIRVHLQVLSPSLRQMQTLPEVFVRSARRAAGVRHAHLEEIFDVGSVSGVPFFAAPPLDGPTLTLRLGVPWLVADAVNAIMPVITATGAIHRAGMIHHDLQPDRVVLHRDGPSRTRPMVTGFALAAIRERALQARLTARDAMETAPRYVAPEKTRGTAVSQAADQWSIAAMLYEMIAGEAVRPGRTLIEVLRACDREVPALRDTVPDLPPELAVAVERALAVDPDARHRRLIDFGRALLPFCSIDSEAHWGLELDRVDAEPLGPATDRDPSGSHPFSQLHAGYQGAWAEELRSLPLADDRDDPFDPFGDGEDHTATRNVPPGATPRGRVLGYVVASLAVGAAGAWSLRGAPTSHTRPPTPEAIPAATATPPKSVPFSVRVTPAGATIELDDAVVAHGTFESKLPQDGRTYRVKARAPGYRTEVRLVDADRPVAIDFELVPLADPAVAPAASAPTPNATTAPGPGRVRPRPRPLAAPPPAPTGETPPAPPIVEAPAEIAPPAPPRGLDRSNPYE